MARLAPPKFRIGLFAAALMVAANNASALSLFDSQPYAREISNAWLSSDDLAMPGTDDADSITLLADHGEARPHWRSEFNPLHLESTGGNGFTQLALPMREEPVRPQPAALAMTGIGLATFLGGRRKIKPARP